MRPSFVSPLGLLAAFSLAACSSASSPPSQPAPPLPNPNAPALLGADCDPMVPTECGFPFPSNVYLVDDPSAVTSAGTGKHVAFGATSLPLFNGRDHVDPSRWLGSDGFSPGQAPMTHMPGATVTGLATPDTIPLSITDDSPTLLIEADTGVRVPHFAELDESYPYDDSRALMIRPVVRLKDATRYIVAIRRVVDASGAALPASPVFAALRDGTASSDVSVGRRRDLYADIFAKLAAAGVGKADLQIAWDYSTASQANNTRALLHMRDDALAAVGPSGPPYVITSVEENPNAHIRRRIHGAMTVPLYLTQPGPGADLVLGSDGLPTQNGTAAFDFVVQIPNSATTGTPGPPLQTAHGLFGNQLDGVDGYLADIADKGDFVEFQVDLIGMATEDESFVANTLVGDIGDFRLDVARQHQGLLNELLAMRMMKGAFANDPHVIFNGKSAIDPTQAYYRGDSQGGIFGTTYMALSTDVTRALLGEPGFPYNLMLNRSADANAIFIVLRSAYRNPLDAQLALGLMQMLWDRTEPDGYAPYVTSNMLPGTPAHTVLLHAAIGDHQVTTLATHILARTVGAQNLLPVNRSLFGIPEITAPVSGGSVLVEYTFGLPPEPLTNVPASAGSDPHDTLPTLDSAERQSFAFFRTGTITQVCTGACSGVSP